MPLQGRDKAARQGAGLKPGAYRSEEDAALKGRRYVGTGKQEKDALKRRPYKGSLTRSQKRT